MTIVKRQIDHCTSYGIKAIYTDDAKSRIDPGVLQDVCMSNLSGVLRQLSLLSSYSTDMFTELYEMSKATSQKVSTLDERMHRINHKLDLLEQKQPSDLFLPVEEPRVEIDDHSFTESTHNLFTSDKRYVLANLYEKTIPPPAVEILDEFRKEGAGSSLKKYSDPEMFFRTWLQEEEERQRKRMKKREERKRQKAKLQKVKQHDHNGGKAVPDQRNLKTSSTTVNSSTRLLLIPDDEANAVSDARAHHIKVMRKQKHESSKDIGRLRTTIERARKPKRIMCLIPNKTKELDPSAKSVDPTHKWDSRGHQDTMDVTDSTCTPAVLGHDHYQTVSKKREPNDTRSKPAQLLPQKPQTSPTKSMSTQIGIVYSPPGPPEGYTRPRPPPIPRRPGANQIQHGHHKTDENDAIGKPSAFLSSIHQGTKLKPVSTTVQSNSGTEGPNDLFGAIRQGSKLKSMSSVEKPKQTTGGQNDLLAAIRQGSKLKSVSNVEKPKHITGGQNDLLAAIRQGAKLKSVKADTSVKPEDTGNSDSRMDILSAIRSGRVTLKKTDPTIKSGLDSAKHAPVTSSVAEILARRMAIMGGNDEDSSDSEGSDSWDDDE